MARLECNLREVSAEGYPPATLIELVGSVDPDTLEIFEEAMDQVAESGRPHVIFDMHRLKYINSTGMGMLVQFVDNLREEGGGLVLQRIQPKVLLVVEMLGLQELFQIVSSEEEALVALAGGEVGPQSIEVKLDEPDRDKVPEAVPVIEIDDEEEAGEEQGVPISGALKCPACQAMLVAPVSGNYRCPRCSSALSIDENGEIEAYPEAADQVLELCLPADTAYLESASSLLAQAARQSGLDEPVIAAVARSARGCLELLAKHAVNGNSPDRRLHLFVRPDIKHLTVRIYCSGSGLGSKEVFEPFREGVDRLDYMASAQGNLVTLEKRT